jgi:ADP-ribose pyrophosphatase
MDSRCNIQAVFQPLSTNPFDSSLSNMTMLCDREKPELGVPLQPMNLVEARLSSTQVLNGGFLQVWRDEIRSPDGSLHTREYIKHPGAVVIVALLDDDTAVMERQYRYPLQRSMVELPAGKLEANERGLEGAGAVPGATQGVWACAQRELAEETGYTASHWAYAGAMHNAIAYSDEIIHICFARGLTAGAQNLDHGEFVDVFSASFDDLVRMNLNGEMTDAKTTTALMWWQQMRLGKWLPNWQSVQTL